LVVRPYLEYNMAKKIETQIKKVLKYYNRQIAGHAAHSPITAGLAGEGYNGGYRDALRRPVIASHVLIRGIDPSPLLYAQLKRVVLEVAEELSHASSRESCAKRVQDNRGEHEQHN